VTTSVKLSSLEHQALRLTAEGATPHQVTRILVVQDGTVRHALARVRRKLGATTNEQAVLIAAWHHAHLLAGCVVKHGTGKAVDWHTQHGVALCSPCAGFSGKSARKPSSPFRRLTPVADQLNSRRGAPVECGSIQAARRHVRAGERVNDLTCGCREAYREWWRDYQKSRTAC
jgi:DNA-binding CsgD family transcriptional regulator